MTQMIQDLNKEIEYHDKVIKVLLETVKDKAASDDAILDALSTGKSLDRQFYLREELLEEIKKKKARVTAMRKRIEM